MHTNDVIAQTNQPMQSNFTYRVKLIEEFFERFNYTANAFILKELKNQGLSTTRENLLISLFNHQQSWDTLSINKFITKVTSSRENVNINYSDDNWYAEVEATFDLNGEPTPVYLILKPEYLENKSAWVLIGVRCDTLFKVIDLPAKDTTSINSIIELDGSFIRPMSHGINFIDFFRVFRPRKNWDGIAQETFSIDKLSYFFALIDYGVLKFVQNNSITFHFLQVENWIFEVQYFNRQDVNSGWLISNLMPVKQKDKENYLFYLLYEE